MQFNIKVEKPSKVLRKITVTVPAEVVDQHFAQKYDEVGKTAKIKGFRPGKIPREVVKKYYGQDVTRKVMSSLIDRGYSEAIRQEKLQPVGQPSIDATEEAKKNGQVLAQEGAPLTFVATVEVFPEIELKSYTGFSLKKDKVNVGQKDVEALVNNIAEQHAELVPVNESDTKKIAKGDFVDFEFKGGLVTETGVEEREGMSGKQVLEIGSGRLIPGFEDELVGLKKGEEKTFKITFPEDYDAKDLAGKEAQFEVKINELKEKKVPSLDDEFAKDAGYESVVDMKQKAEEALKKNQETEADQKLKNELLTELIKKNPFDVPTSLIQAQVQANVRDLVENWRRQGIPESEMTKILEKEQGNLEKRAENQIRAGFLLEEIAKKENIQVKDEAVAAEIDRMAQSMNMTSDQLNEFYKKEPKRKEGLVFRLREEETINYIISQSKVK